jgi:hypothetical protein
LLELFHLGPFTIRTDIFSAAGFRLGVHTDGTSALDRLDKRLTWEMDIVPNAGNGLEKGLNKMYLYSQIKNGSLPMLTYIQDITAAEAQRKHRTPESPDGYFPDRCLKNTFSFFKVWVFFGFCLILERAAEARKEDGKAREPRASNRGLRRERKG